VVQVEDAQHRPLSGVHIGIEGLGGSGRTGDDGKAKLSVGASTKPGDWLSFTLLPSASSNNLAIISPWDYRALVPSFENIAENFIRVVVVRKGDRAALESGNVVAALTEKINNRVSHTTSKRGFPEVGPSTNQMSAELLAKDSLETVAREYGLSAKDVDAAIRALGRTATDLYQTGVVALYENNLSKATANLAESLRQREDQVQDDRNAVSRDLQSVADAAFFLGQAQLREGHYPAAAASFNRCVQIRPDDELALTGLAESLEDNGDFTGAEHALRTVQAIENKSDQTDDREVAHTLTALGELFETEGAYAQAKPMLEKALKIERNIPGPRDPALATTLANLGSLFFYEGQYGHAEQLMKEALTIIEGGPRDDPSLAAAYNNLGAFYARVRNPKQALDFLEKGLSIDRRVFPPNHPLIAQDLGNLASVKIDLGDCMGAEPLLNQALEIYAKALPPDHPFLAPVLDDLAVCSEIRNDFKNAEWQLHKAVAIRENTIPQSPSALAKSLSRLATCLEEEGDHASALENMRRALTLDIQALGPYHPDTLSIQRMLDVASGIQPEKVSGFRGAPRFSRPLLSTV
jgi:tetratricopeptide (TPR) repeat protein